MAISYPRDLPTATGIANITLRAVNQTAMTMSPFTYKQQLHNHTARTFLMGDPNRLTARGALGGSPVVNGANQTGSSVSIDGCSNNITGWMKAGDYIQLGAASTARLHKVLQQVDTNGSGQATLDIWPNMVTAPTDGSTVVTSNTVGRWRLNSGEQDWSIDNASFYGITFACVQVIP